ncbi:MAG: SUMF1/EgtB/PvdO family nonheme iron enzyme [Planctomycetaceae bacterium]|nr:SUMF1/EgtB/PvdO family nonheme iron enzyme [Planctomycetaceae bacterium]
MYRRLLSMLLFVFLFVPNILEASFPMPQQPAALLLDESPEMPLSIESMTVSEIADRIANATLVRVDENKPVSFDKTKILWFHLSSSTVEDPRFKSETFVSAVKTFVENGGGLLLTGYAAVFLNSLGLDTITTKPVTFGDDRDQSGVKPLAPTHPIFTELDFERDVFWLSNVAYPAYAQFQWTKGTNLGVNTERTNVPHLEYPLGKGKVLAAPWRIGTIYDKAPKDRQRNLELFVSNMLRYLDGSLTAPAIPPSKLDAEFLALELAVKHLAANYGEQYPNGAKYLERLAQLRERTKTSNEVNAVKESSAELDILRRESLLANPLLNFDRLLLIRRGEKQLGLPMNYTANSALPKKGYDNQVIILSDWKTKPSIQTVLQPEQGRFVGDIDLHFDADRMLMTMIDAKDHWRVFEAKIDGTELKQLPLIPDDDVDCYDACYLPDGSVVFCSTACFAGVPCINGSSPTCNLYRLNTDGSIRQLTYEQDQNWCPTLLNNGRLLYLRWEYTDLPHAYARILFHANPDGTNQTEYYGSGSYWPASMFYAKAVPNHPTKFAAIIGGHHELPRMGDLVLFDPALGRREASGAIQRIPGRDRPVQPEMLDLPIGKTWAKFLHPQPLDEHFFLVSAKPAANKPWGVYLVDTFDNMVLIHEETGYAMLEPIPLKKTQKPPVIPDRIDPERKDAEFFIADIYEGQGLPNVAKGTVKALRLYTYQFAYQNMGAEPYSIGMDGPWDPRRIIGTVPVYEDGSAFFKVPAYTPIAMQPLDEEGKAIQVMRSWVTAMPGETVSCTGCHEEQNTVVMPVRVKASTAPPSEITPWYGPTRGFSFIREVQPVLEKYCTDCHREGNEKYPGIASFVDGPQKPLLDTKNYINVKSRFSRAYYELRRYVRSSTKEGSMQVPNPREYHADTTRLMQLLNAGHYDVKLDSEALDRLITWIDLNAPFHGNWLDIIQEDNPALVKHQFARRHEMRRLYAKMDSLLDDDPNVEYQPAVLPKQKTADAEVVTVKKPVAADVAASPAANFSGASLKIPLNENVEIDLLAIPGQDFYMAKTETTNRQYAVFDVKHDSGVEFGDFMHFSPGERGWPVSHPGQPVVRVSWKRAMDFCRWLSEKSGRRVTLPTEEQWEYACRAGTETPFWYGNIDTDFSRCANLSDVCNQRIDPFGWAGRTETIPAWRPADVRFNDGSRVSAMVGSYRANPWGLHDMHGNVAEWTATALSPDKPERKIVKGGSWYDEPKRAAVMFRQDYFAGQQIYDVGFRIVVLP